MTNDEIAAFISEQENLLRNQFYRTEFSLRYLLRPNQGKEPFERTKLNLILECAVNKGLFGAPLLPPTRNLWGSVRNLYLVEPTGQLLPLHQAIQLLDVYHLCHALMARINARADAKHPALEPIASELKRCGARLEHVVMSRQKAQQMRHLRRPEALESPEDLERSIEREVEIYARLASEAAARLR